MNRLQSEVYVSTYDPECVELHSDTSDFDLQVNSHIKKVKLEKSFRRRSRKHKEIRLLKYKSLSSHISLYYDLINSVKLKNFKKTNVRSTEIAYDYLNFCKERNLKKNSNCIDDESIDNSSHSQNNCIDKHIRSESKSAEQYFLYDTNNIDTKSYVVTNKAPNSSYISENYYINSKNKRADNEGNKNTRPDIYFRIDSNYANQNNRCKSKRIDRYINSESIRMENHSPSDRKLIDNRILRQNNRKDHYIHSEDKRIQNYYNRIENNLTDNYNESLRPDGNSCGENNWPENERKLNSPISLSANRVQANKKIIEKKNKVKRQKVCDDLENGVLHSSSSRWPQLKQKYMPRLCNILGRFGSNAVAQKNTHDKCKWCSPLDDVTLLYCSKCKTTRTGKNPIQAVQSIHTVNENAQNYAPFDKVKYVQYGAARVLHAADIDKNLLQFRCSNCSLSSTSDSEMVNEKIRQKLEKRFKKKIKKYFNRQIKQESVKEKIRRYPYEDINYASIDVKTSPCSASSHFLDSIFRGINKKYQDKQTESRKKHNLNTLNARVGDSNCKDEIIGSNYRLSSNKVHKQGKKSRSSCEINKQQQITHSSPRVDPIMGFGCQCIQRQGDKDGVPNSRVSRPMQSNQKPPIYHPPAPIRPIPRKLVSNSKIECGCTKGRKRKMGKLAGSAIRRSPQLLPPPPPRPPPPHFGVPHQNQGRQESCDECCQQPHDKMLQAVQKQYNGEIICIHNPPCVLINGCLKLPPNTGRNPHTTAVYCAAEANKIPPLHNPRLGLNMKISNICEKCTKNRTSHWHRGPMSKNIKNTTQGMNTCKPYLFDMPLNETSKNQPKLETSPEKVPKILETQSTQVEILTNEVKTEDNTKINPFDSDISKYANHPTAPTGDVNTITQVKHRYSTFCHNTCGTQCLYKPDYTTPQLSQGRNSELPIYLMNYSDYPVIKENASAQVTPEADPKLENYCVHIPIYQKLRNCDVQRPKYEEIPTTLSYKSQTSNMNLISLKVKETVSVQTTINHSKKSFSINMPVKEMSKCVSDKSSLKKAQQKEKPELPETEKHFVALTAVDDNSTQVRERKRDSNFRQHAEREVFTKGNIAGDQVRRRHRQLICRHYPQCILVHECVGKQLTDSITVYGDIPECSHKRCCELIPACLARNVKGVKAVSSQHPPNTCHII